MDEESMSEGFSASEDEWVPCKDKRGGESSDDDDSEFEDLPVSATENLIGGVAAAASGGAIRKSREPKSAKNAAKQGVAKKRKPNQSLRSKLFNKYRPPPKTLLATSPKSNSPSASTSRTASKNARAPNESSADTSGSNSESSVEDYLVNPADLDLQSSFFNVQANKQKPPPPPPVFDCNAGLVHLTDSGSEDNNESSADECAASAKAFDFRNLLEKANSLERAKETIAKRAAEAKTESTLNTAAALDINSLLALGEMQNRPTDDVDNEKTNTSIGPQKLLSKTKSTRIKRHTKTRPSSTLVVAPGGGGDSDDSDWEEVADSANSSVANSTRNESLEIHVELAGKKPRSKEAKRQQNLELALKMQLNRELKKRQLLLHKTSLLCHFGRSYNNNRMLNDTTLMQAALKLLPSKSAYPPERGTELKYYQSLVTWFKTAVKLASPKLYGAKKPTIKKRVKLDLLEQIKHKEARCKEEMVFIFVILLRGMGLQCRMIVNMQPLPLKPAKSDLLTIKMKANDSEKKSNDSADAKPKIESKAVSDTSKAKIKNEEQKPSAIKKIMDKTHNIKEENKVVEVKSVAPKEKTIIPRSKKVENERAEKISISSSCSSKKTLDDKLNSNKKSLQSDTIKQSKLAATKRPKLNSATERCSESKLMRKACNKDKPIVEIGSPVLPTIVIRAGTQVVKKSLLCNADDNTDNKAATATSTSMTKLGTNERVTRSRSKSPNFISPKFLQTESYKQKFTSPEPPTTTTNTKLKPPSKSPQDKVKISPKFLKNSEAPTRLLRSRQKINDNSKIPQLDGVNDSPSQNAIIEFTPIAFHTRHALNDKSTIAAVKPFTPIAHHTRQYERQHHPPDYVDLTTPPEISIRSGKENKTQMLETALEFTPIAKRTRLKSKLIKAPCSPVVPAAKSAVPKKVLSIINTNTALVAPTASTTSQVTSRNKNKKLNQSSSLQSKQHFYFKIPQIDGADDLISTKHTKRPQLKKLKKSANIEDFNSDDDFEPSPTKRPKKAPVLPKTVQKLRTDRRVLSTDIEDDDKKSKAKDTAADVWVEVWSDLEEQWICVDLFTGKLHSVEAIRKSASSSLAYVYAFQNDLSIKDVTARYCPHWTTTVRKARVEKAWLDEAISSYQGHRTRRDIREDHELRRIHEEKPMPSTISDYKDHPLYALERHLLKFQAIYPPEPPTLGFIRSEPVYSRDCVHTLHSREIWLKQARTVKLGEQPYKVVKARPKWDRLTQTVIKDQPLEIFGYWQTEQYEPPTAENGLVPRNAYGNVELFKECMLPKKTVHLRLNGLNRICKKLGIDCANAVVGFDFHQGACHPTFDGFIVCEEFKDTVTAAWHQDQEDQERKDQEKYETRVYGNWKKLIRGLLIRERLKKKYNF